jgi:arylsulfatase A-like enzyme
MIDHKGLFIAARISFILFMLATSVYCLLAYIPFSYFHFLKFNHISWLTAFVKYHPYLYCLAAGFVSSTVIVDLHRQKTRNLARFFLLFLILIGIALLSFQVLANLQNHVSSFLYSLFSLLPLLWLALIDWLGNEDKIEWSSVAHEEDRHIFRTSLFAALFISLLYAGIFYLRQKQQATGGLNSLELLVAVGWSLASHLLLFMALFVIFNLIRAIAKLFPAPSKAEFVLCDILAIAMTAFSVRNIALAGISFTGRLADLYSFAAALVVVGSLASLSVKLYRAEHGAIRSGLAFAMMPLTFGRITSRLARAIWCLAIAAIAYLLAIQIASFDWNYLAQKLTVNMIWVLTFASLYAMTKESNSKRDLTYALLLVAALSLGFYKLLDASQAQVAAMSSDKTLDVRATLERYSGQDVSFQLIHDMLTPARDDGSFYLYLQQNTNLPQDTKIEPVEMKLVADLTPAKDLKKPNIFIFTVDSLRQDYLSPYNQKIQFTPAIQRFAQESIVMENAFTHYGATGLSEPSIWVGGMSIHKQYVTPFYPMNTLQKLLETEGYQCLITMDTILKVILKPAPYIEDLIKDAEDQSSHFEFCSSLKSLQNRLDNRPANAPPVFAYTQPQNLHISVITREGKTILEDSDYGSFYAPYASRIKKFDDCFGEFIAYLKQRDLYDNSIIILTSDHGDSLGEEGRWGHAYTIFPEIIRIPLIVHLPESMRTTMVWDTKNVAFSTDITPSLYYLLGHKPIIKNELNGRPLFTGSQQEQTDYLRPWYLLASSYGAVYGILSNNGRALYIADGVNYTDYFYDLERDPAGTTNRVNPAITAENQKLIRDGIGAINQMYNFGQ